MKANILSANSLFAGSFTCQALAAATTGYITGLGGVFVTSKDPKALAKWYKAVLGISLESWGGTILRYDAPGHAPMALWNAMSANSDEIVPSHREFMIKFAVDDLDAFAAWLESKGVTVLKRESDQTGSSPPFSIQTERRSSSGSRPPSSM